MIKILYISYTGMTDTLGESQVLSYMLGLTEKGCQITIVSAEKPEKYFDHKLRIQNKLKDSNVFWRPVAYHKSPPVISTILDFRNMRREVLQILHESSFDIVHCRGYIPALLGIKLKRKFNLPFIFDMRGFWPDEKLESGAWDSTLYKPIYKFFKKKEKNLFKHADRIVSLTVSGKTEIVSKNWAEDSKIGIIPTCVNFQNFPKFDPSTREKVRSDLNLSSKCKVLLYSGSLGGNYDMHIPFKIFESFQKISEESHFLILSRSDPEMVHHFMKENGINDKHVTITSVPFPEVHRYLMAGDMGLIFYGPGYSNKGRSPTKLGEYWACGLPAISLKNIGDVEKIIEKYPDSGIILGNLDPTSIADKLRSLPKKTDRIKLREYSKDYYSLEKGIKFYKRQYQNLLSN